MKRRSRAVLEFTLIVSIMLGIIPCTAFTIDDIGSSKPIQLTTDPHYDRNPSLLLADDRTYWLFFTRGRDDQGVRGYPSANPLNDPYNPDLDYYSIWYKRSRSLERLEGAFESLLPLGPPDTEWSSQRDVAALEAGDGKIWVFTSPGYGPEQTDQDRGILSYLYDGSWTGPSIIHPGNHAGCGIGHIDALTFQDRVFLIFDECTP